MRSTVFNALFFLCIISVFSGCRKGEEDPAISLRSRDARISGTWILTNYSGTVRDFVEDDNGGFVPVTYTFSYTLNYQSPELSLLNITTDTPYESSRTSFKYGITMTIDKNGRMQLNINDKSNGMTIYNERESSWFWLNAGKNKSKIHLGAFRSDMGVGEFDVIRLSNDELKLHSKNSDNYSNLTEEVFSQDLIMEFTAQ